LAFVVQNAFVSNLCREFLRDLCDERSMPVGARMRQSFSVPASFLLPPDWEAVAAVFDRRERVV
jgi:hypothetical protein